MKPTFMGLAALALLVPSSACGPAREEPAGLEGRWRATLESPGGELPFTLVIGRGEGDDLTGVILNGPERVAVDRVEREGDHIRLSFGHYDSSIEATLAAAGDRLEGAWSRQSGTQRERMVFHARRGAAPRFPPLARAGETAGLKDVTGDWEVRFTDDEGDFPARGEFRQESRLVRGTFLTPEGDYRYLAGAYEAGILRLSCFDGGHAFLFHARVADDGSLEGEFWSRGSYHARWLARRTDPDARVLPDPYSLTRTTNPSRLLRFSFPDLDGNIVSNDDKRFQGKVLLVDIFGSWCPNCNDEAPLLVDLYREYHDAGLEIVGLAFEMTGDPERDRRFVRRHARRYDIPYPLLLAGTKDKTEASHLLPDLTSITAFPTLIFIGRDGLVKDIHTGFAGPGTGRHFIELKDGYVKRIERLLAATPREDRSGTAGAS